MPTIYDNLRRSGYQRPWMKNYKDPLSAPRYGESTGFIGGGGTYHDSPGGKGFTNTTKYFSDYAPGTAYSSFEEALAVGKEARTRQELEDYKRYAMALGIPISDEGYAQYSKERGAERGLEMTAAQKNAEIARDQANRNRKYMFDVLQADRAARLKARDQQIAIQRERGKQDRWYGGGSGGGGGSGYSRANRSTTQAVTAVGSGAFNNATEKQVVDYLIRAGVNEHQLNTGIANWRNKRTSFQRGNEKYTTGFESPATQGRELGKQQEQDIKDLVERGNLTGLADLPVDNIPEGRRPHIEAYIKDRRQSTLNNREKARQIKIMWDQMFEDHKAEQEEREPDKKFKPSPAMQEQYREFINEHKEFVLGDWQNPHFTTRFNDEFVGEDFESVNPFSKVVEPGDEPVTLPPFDSPRADWEGELEEIRGYERKYGSQLGPFSDEKAIDSSSPHMPVIAEKYRKSGIPRRLWPAQVKEFEAQRGREWGLRQRAAKGGMDYESPEFQAMIKAEEEQAAHDQFMADYSRKLRATQRERELAKPPQPQGADTDDPFKLAQYEAILAPPMQRDPIEVGLEKEALRIGMQEDIAAGGGELPEYRGFDMVEEWEDRIPPVPAPETSAYRPTPVPPDEHIPYYLGRNTVFADPTDQGLVPAWGAQVAGPHLENPNWEALKAGVGGLAAAPFDSVKGLSYGVNKGLINPLLSFAETATGEPFSDYHLATEGIFQDRAAPVMNPTAYTKDGRKPRITTELFMNKLLPIAERQAMAARRAAGRSDTDGVTDESIANLLEQFEIVDMDKFYEAQGLGEPPYHVWPKG